MKPEFQPSILLEWTGVDRIMSGCDWGKLKTALVKRKNSK